MSDFIVTIKGTVMAVRMIEILEDPYILHEGKKLVNGERLSSDTMSPELMNEYCKAGLAKDVDGNVKTGARVPGVHKLKSKNIKTGLK